MEQTEALNKINEIYQVIEGSNKYLFSGKMMMAIGALLIATPFIEIATDGLTFQNVALQQNTLLVALIHFLFYASISKIMGKILGKNRNNLSELNPLIAKAFSIKRPIMVAVSGVIFSFIFIGQGQLIHPILFILFGFLFGIYGRFSIPIVSIMSWVFIFVGFIYACLTKFDIPHLWVFMLVLNGLCYMVMGYFLLRAARE